MQKPWNIQFKFNTASGSQSFSLINDSFADGNITIDAKQIQSNWHLSLQLSAVNLHKIHQELLGLLPELNQYPINTGKITASIDSSWQNANFSECETHYSVSELSIDGEQVLEEVSLSGKLELKNQHDKWFISNQTIFNSGAMYLTPGFDVFDAYPGFYLDLEQQAISINSDISLDKDHKQLTVNDFKYDHGEILQVSATGHINIKPEISIPDSDFNVLINNLEQAYPVYLEPILLPTNYADLDVAGKMKIHLVHKQAELEKLELDLDDIFIDDERQRFGIAGFNSQIAMQNSLDPVSSTIHWDGISIYKLLLGPGDMRFISHGNNYQIENWNNVDLFDGEIEIEDLVMSKLGQEDFSFKLSGHLKPISLSTFTSTMGWPVMSGDIGGEVSGLSYQNNHLNIDGDILISVFDGTIRLGDFYIDNLFSSYSRLHSNILVNQLDLEQLTNTFTFGKIQGSLNGYLKDFTLENWQPVAFDAAFETPEQDHRPHRISQKALDNISELGGGITGALSKGFLSFIPEYSYGQLGIKCLLKMNVCQLGGVKETESGFFILTKGGLLPPWVAVKGTGRSIRWPDLIDGLKQISTGEISIQ